MGIATQSKNIGTGTSKVIGSKSAKDKQPTSFLGTLYKLAADISPEVRAVRDSSSEVNDKTGVELPNVGLQKFLNDNIRDIVRTITNPNKPYGNNIIETAIKTITKEQGLKSTAKELNKFGLKIDTDKVKDISDILTKENIISLGENLSQGKIGPFSGLRDYYDRSIQDSELDAIDNPDKSISGRLPSNVELLRSSYMPSSIKDGKAIYEDITSKNQDKYFSQKEIGAIGSILGQRDAEEIVGEMPIGEIDFGKDYKAPPALSENYLTGKPIEQVINETFGKASYGHYNENGEWQAGVPDVEGNYNVKDTYNWNRGYKSGLQTLFDVNQRPSKIREDDVIEGITQVTGPSSREDEGQKLSIKVPVYNNDPMGQMDLIDRRGLENSGGLPGMYWQPEAFGTDDSTDDSTDDGLGDNFSEDDYSDLGYSDDYNDSVFMEEGGQVSDGLDNVYMNKRDSKQKLYNMMGFQSRQYGGGLDDAYMNRRSAFAPPDVNSAFASPMSQGGLPTIYRESGGGADYEGAAEDYADMAAQEEASSNSGADDGSDGYDWNFNQAGGYNYQTDAKAGNLGVDEFGVKIAAPQTGYTKEELEDMPYLSEDQPIGTTEAVRALMGTKEGFDWLNEAQGLRQGDNFGFKKGNVGQIQRGIDRGLYQGIGIPTANALESKGLATFGKAMRGPFEVWTPGDALYRDEDEDSLAAGRGIYGEQGFMDSSEESKELGMRIRYAKPGETIADIATQMFNETGMRAPTENLGYDITSTAQASQVYESLNDSRISGLFQGLGLMGTLGISPIGFVNQLSRGSAGGGKETSMIGDIKDKATSELRSVGERLGFVDPEVEPEAPGMSDKLSAAIQNQQIYSDISNMKDNRKADVELSMGSLAPDPEEPASERGLPSVMDTLEFIDNPSSYLTNIDPTRTNVFSDPTVVERQISEALKEESASPSEEKEAIDTSSNKESNFIEDIVKGAGNLIGSFGDSVSKFLTNTFGSGNGRITQPDQPVVDNTYTGGLSGIRRKQQDQPKDAQVAAIVAKVAKTPVQVQRSIEERGLTPQYLSLIRAGYTIEEAIKAIGAPAGTALT